MDRGEWRGVTGGEEDGLGWTGAFMNSQMLRTSAEWDREADIVVIGAGATGLPAAIVAREAGAAVISFIC